MVSSGSPPPPNRRHRRSSNGSTTLSSGSAVVAAVWEGACSRSISNFAMVVYVCCLVYFIPPASAFTMPPPRHLPVHGTSASVTVLRMKSDEGAQSKATDQPGRRKKKNKYASFSKTDKLEKDPFEQLLGESEAKIRDIEIEQAKKKNKQVPVDEETLQTRREEKRERNKVLFPDTKEIDPYDPTTYGYTELGTVLGAHGVHGWMKVSAVTEFPERLCEHGIRHVKAPNRRSPREVMLLEGKHRLDDEYLVRLDGVGDRDASNKLRGSVLYARQTERPRDIGEDEYLVTELVGLDVFLEEGYMHGDEDDASTKGETDETESLGGKFVGTVGGILLAEDMCAVPGLGQDMIEVVLPRGRAGGPSWRDELVLIPFVPQIVPTVDLVERIVYISPPLGLMDLTYIKEEKVRIKGFLPPAKDDGGAHKH